MSSLIWVWARARDCGKHQRQACPGHLHAADSPAEQSHVHMRASVQTWYKTMP